MALYVQSKKLIYMWILILISSIFNLSRINNTLHSEHNSMDNIAYRPLNITNNRPLNITNNRPLNITNNRPLNIAYKPRNISKVAMQFLNLSVYQKILNYSASNNMKRRWARINIDSREIKYCCRVTAGLGNILSMYWTARALVFFSSSSFQLVLNNKCFGGGRQSRELFTYSEPLYFMVYLPKYSKINMFNYYNLSNTTYNLLSRWRNNSIHKYHKTFDTFSTPLQSLYYNPLFLPIIRKESHEAFLKMNLNSVQFTSVHDIVIHFRCGDIFGLNETHHGFIALSFYKKALEIINSKYSYHGTENMSVWFLTQTGSRSLRQWTKVNESKYQTECISLVNNYVPYLKDLVFDKYKFNVIGNGDTNEDFYRMSFAPNLIVSMSTFSQQAAIINANTVILPDWGPFAERSRINSSSYWIPSNHKYVNLLNSWVSSRDITTKRWDVQRIVNYLVTH
eukprot:235000_1